MFSYKKLVGQIKVRHMCACGRLRRAVRLRRAAPRPRRTAARCSRRHAAPLAPQFCGRRPTSKTDVHVNLPDIRDPYYLMHRRLAHIGNTVYDTTVAAVEGLPKRGHHKSGCPCCALGKSTVKRHARDATLKRASIGQGWNQSITVQFTRAGNFRARLRIASPTGLKHKTTCKFFLISPM